MVNRWMAAAFFLVFLAACTAQEEQLVHDLEDMPGITCIQEDGEDKCGPDSLTEALEDDSGA